MKLAPDIEDREEVDRKSKSKKRGGKLISGLRTRKVGESIEGDKEKDHSKENNLNTLEAEKVEDEVEPTSANIPAFGTGFLEVPGGDEWR